MRYLAMLLVVLAALVIQSTVLSGLKVLDAAPNLPLLIVVAWAVVDGFEEGLIWALVAGLLTDLVSAAPFGVATMALVAAVLVAVLVVNSTLTRSTFLPPISMAAATAAYYVALGLALQVAGWPTHWFQLLTEVALPAMIMHAILLAPVYWVVNTVVRRRQLVAGLR